MTKISLIKFLFFIFLTMFLAIQLAKADNLKLNVGLNSLHSNINDPNYSYVNQYEDIKNLNISAGATYIFDNKIVLGFSTNRLYRPERKRTAENNSGVEFENKTKLTTDSFLIGYAYKRFIPSIFIANVRDQEALYYKGQQVGSSDKTAILAGVNLSYFLTKEIAGSVFYVLPNQELNLESGFGVGINYYFDIL